MHKLTLGTAQLGMNYGINNKIGKPLVEECLSILNYAYNHNIRSFDTASVYGNSESILGTWLKDKHLDDIILTSKISSLATRMIHHSNLEKELRICLETSLKNLNINRLNQYLIHDFNDVRVYNEKIFIFLDKFKNEGLIESYGCSIYDIDELEHIMKYDVGSIQIPGSIFNQVILESSLLKKIKSNGTMVFVRSVFVQGLIFMNDDEIPENLRGIEIYLNKLRNMVKDREITIAEAALNYVRNHPNTDSVVFGVESINQIKELLSIKNNNELNSLDINRIFSEIPLELFDPRYWR